MVEALNYAKYFIKQNPEAAKNNFDGNMRLQKLLLFSTLLSLAEHGTPLFEDEILAFEQGCVIETVRQRYKNDYNGLMDESRDFNTETLRDKDDILTLAVSLFGELSARELSDINHAFDFWKSAYKNSMQPDGYKDKSKSVVSIDAMRNELARVKMMLESVRLSKNESNAKETINGIDFYYSPSEIEFTEDVESFLYGFSRTAEDKSFSVYRDGESLVVY